MMMTPKAWRQWTDHFRERLNAPPGGWAVYLREGWRQSLSEWRTRYALYLRSSAWQLKRSGIIRRVGRCQNCAATTRLHVHHVNYENVGLERIEDLRLLCQGCHKLQHSSSRPIPIPLDNAAIWRIRSRPAPAVPIVKRKRKPRIS